MLFLIGLGLWDKKDISVKGLEAVQSCDYVYLEHYTSVLSDTVDQLENFYGKQIIVADRKQIEVKSDEILEKARKSDVALLIIGDVFAATTHIDFKIRAMDAGIKVKIIHNASVLTAVGETGLELYKFGKVTSIPFEHDNVTSPIDVLKMNFEKGLHTLFLFDLDPADERFMRIPHAAEYLLKHIDDCRAVGCAGLGGEPEIKVGMLSELMQHKFTKIPQCLIIPGNLHFMEEEALKWYS